MERPCTILIAHDRTELPTTAEIKKQLEDGSVPEKRQALKYAILLLLSGDKSPQGLIMTMIKCILHVRDHHLKKLLLIYWETVQKKSADGKLLPEFILVCNALLNDLKHANEYVRGSTLRFLCRLKEPELLEPLMPTVRLNLEHRVSYVKRNAVLTLYSVYKEFDYLCPDAPELIYNFLVNEPDLSCKRNAFIMLFNCAQDKAVEYLSSVLDQVSTFGDVLQYSIVELIRKVCRTNPAERSKYIRCVFGLLTSSSSPSVKFECASALLSLSSAPTAVKAATSTFIELLCSQSDSNVKMIILDRLLAIKQRYPKMMQDLLMDVLRVLVCPNVEVRRKTLKLVLDLVSPANIDEVILLLKKEVNRTQSNEDDQSGEYRHLLIRTVHAVAVRFPDVAGNVVHVLMDFLGDSNLASAVDVIVFVREVVETYPDQRRSIVEKLLQCMDQIKSSKVYRSALWIVGEYSSSLAEIESGLSAIKELLGPLPFISNTADEGTTGEETLPSDPVKKSVSGAPQAPRVLSDGTYASQSAISAEAVAVTPAALQPTQGLRGLLCGGDSFLGSVVAVTLTKLVVRMRQHKVDPIIQNSVQADAMLICTSLALLAKESTETAADADSLERIIGCVKILYSPELECVGDIFLVDCRSSLSRMLAEQKEEASEVLTKTKQPEKVSVQADDLLKIRQLHGKKGISPMDVGDLEDDDLMRVAMGIDLKEQDYGARLNRMTQLTGFSDPIYAEAFVTVHQYDILLEIVIVNQTGDTLQNLAVELATLGDLKLVDRPQGLSVGPYSKKMITANIKVSSTDTGIIFGSIVYDIAGKATVADKNCIILDEIHIDIMDYIFPATCTELQFRSMWLEFEWENKVSINTTIGDINEFLAHILKTTNMRCLTPPSALSGDCGFLAANLYAKSIFGEDALANLSVERQADGRIGGYVRIRSKTQGIALSLGDKITLRQKA